MHFLLTILAAKLLTVLAKIADVVNYKEIQSRYIIITGNLHCNHPVY